MYLCSVLQRDCLRETALHYENVNNKKEGKKKYELFIPRYHEVIELQEEKEGFPGPGQYEMKSQFQKRENSPKNQDGGLCPVTSG
ncbi:sperm-tail PG-rich repeat-containing protein 2 [Ciconia boyciana]|uniref:sperm-tail PG-rich repeat-containing protein 2 n=1 Tax=Ciconia boyciana TaxID=52775 RepID=UPI003BA1EE66